MSTTSTLNPARSGAGSKILPNFLRPSPWVHIQPRAIPSLQAAARARTVSPPAAPSRLSLRSSAPSRVAPAIAEVPPCTSARNRPRSMILLGRQPAPILPPRREGISLDHHFPLPLHFLFCPAENALWRGLVIATGRSNMAGAMGGDALIQYRFDSVEQLA